MFSKIKKAKKWNKKAFQELIDTEKNKLYRIAYLYAKNEQDALDIVQETICKAYISIKNLKDPNYFSSWLTKILINTALDLIKEKNRVIPMEEFHHIPDENEQKLEKEEKMDLAEAIKRLKEPYKTIIILRYYKDFQIRQIADTLGCPEGTVKTQLHRAVNNLKFDLREEGFK
jgi:RNA polymerase sigma-70 factor (ECF subfamily)